MKKHSHAWAVALLSQLLTLSAVSTAQAVESINVQTFNPSTSDHFVILEDGLRSEWPKVSKYFFGANYNYVSEPLVATDNLSGARAFTIIDSIQTVDVFFGFKPTPKFGLFFGAPVHTVTYPTVPGNAALPTGSATVFGDLKIIGKIRLSDDVSPTAVTLIPEFHLPTGNTQNFVSDASTYLALRMAIEHQFEHFMFTGNIGFATAANAEYQATFATDGIDYRKRLILGIGAFIPFNDTWGMNLEFNSIHMLPFNKNLNPNELYAGLRYAATDSWAFTAGGSLGKIGGDTGQNFRAVVGLRYTYFDEEAAKANNQRPRPVTITPQINPPVAANPTPWPSPSPYSAPTHNSMTAHAFLRAKRIELLSPINFENDSAQIAGDSTGVLNEVTELMKKNPKSFKKIYVDGHTSNPGTDQYNLKLSLDRAKAVKAYLVKRGVPANKLEARGYGRRVPKVSPREPRANEINRRVEFIVVN